MSSNDNPHQHVWTRALGSLASRWCVGNDGLTRTERRESLARYRAVVGDKSVSTAEHRSRVEQIEEKLEPRPWLRPQPSL